MTNKKKEGDASYRIQRIQFQLDQQLVPFVFMFSHVHTFRTCPNHNFLSKPLCSEDSIGTILLFHIYKLTTFKTV